jgi:hypothetical protein
MANEKIIFDTEVKVGSSVGSVKSLKAELRAVTNELGNLEEGSAAFVAAAQKAGQLKDKISDVKNVVSAFNPEAKFQALAGAVGIAANGFSAMQGVMALMGGENQKLNEVIAKTQGAIALATGLNGLLGMKDAFNVLKLTSIASFNAIRTSAVATFSTIKGAMAATGIGALVVALGYLVTKFIETSAANEEATKKEKEYTEQTKKTKEATDEKVKSIELEIIAIQNKTNAAGATLIYAKAEKAALEEQITTAEKNIEAQNKALEQGKEVTAFEFVNINAIKEKLKVKNEEIKNLEIISNKTKEFETVKTDADNKEKARLKNIQDAKDREKKILESNEYYANESLKSKNKYAKESIEFDQYWAKEAEKSKKEYDKIALDKHIVSLKEISTNERLSFDERLAAYRQLATEKIITDTQLKDAEIAIEREKRLAKTLELDAYAEVLNASSNLLGKNTVEGKAMAIAAATISTYTAISKTLAAFAGVPLPGYAIVQAIATGIAGFAAVKNIIDTPIPNTSGGGGGVAPTAPRIPQSVNGTILSQNKPITTTSVGGTVGKVIVVETDITNTQDKVKNIIRKATIK